MLLVGGFLSAEEQESVQDKFFLRHFYDFNPHLVSLEGVSRLYVPPTVSPTSIAMNAFGRALAFSPNLGSPTVVVAGYANEFASNIGTSYTNTLTLTAANTQTAYNMACLARYNYVTGALDTTFNPTKLGIDGTPGAGYAGQVITDFGANTFPLRVVIQPGDLTVGVTGQKIIVVGYTYLITTSSSTNQYAVFVAKYNWDGSLDTTFNVNGPTPGIVITPVSVVPNQPNLSGFQDQGFAVALQPTDNKIVVTGTATGQLFVLRYNNAVTVPATAGTLDTTFNPQGYTYNFNNVVPVISTPNNTTPGIFVCSILGTISYSNTGVSIVGSDCGYAVAVQPADNKIVVAGTGFSAVVPSNSHVGITPSTTTNPVNTGPNQIILLRLNPNGTPDTTFGKSTNGVSSGIQVTKIIGFNDQAYALGLQANGSIVVAGTSSDVYGNYALSVVRYTSSGVLDTTFGNLLYGYSSIAQKISGPFGPVNLQGKVLLYVLNTVNSICPYSAANVLRIQPDGKIVVAGYNSYNISINRFAIVVARFLPTGQLDPSFNPTGIPQGFASVVGPIPSSSYLATSFGTPKQIGVQTVSIQGQYDQAFDVALQPDGSGKIMVAGQTWNTAATGQLYQFTLARLLSNGIFDTTGTAAQWNPLIFSFTNV